MSARPQPSTAHTNCSHTSPTTNTPDLNTSHNTTHTRHSQLAQLKTRTSVRRRQETAIDSKLHNTAMHRGGLAALQHVRGEACVTCPVRQPALRIGGMTGRRQGKIEVKRRTSLQFMTTTLYNSRLYCTGTRRCAGAHGIEYSNTSEQHSDALLLSNRRHSVVSNGTVCLFGSAHAR